MKEKKQQHILLQNLGLARNKQRKTVVVTAVLQQHYGQWATFSTPCNYIHL